MVRTQDGRSHPGPENRMCKTRSQSHLVNRFLSGNTTEANTRAIRATSDDRRVSTPRVRVVVGPPPHAPRESQSESPTGA